MNKVRSRFIMKKIFKIIRNVRKLKVIKYNKKITASLNITKQDFEIYSELNKFNKKYHTDIANAGTKRLNLSKSNLENNQSAESIYILNGYDNIYIKNKRNNAKKELNKAATIRQLSKIKLCKLLSTLNNL